jgi:2-dehydropantoate 2-reductase
MKYKPERVLGEYSAGRYAPEMNIAVIGLGGVGGYFGGKICRHAAGLGAVVHFVARGENLAAIRARGLTVKTAAEGEWTCRPASATDDIQSLPVPDLALVCVKSYDLEAAARKLASIATEKTAVIPLLNGVDIHERIRADIPRARVFPACVFIGTSLESPGVVAQKGGACKINLGPDPEAPSAAPEEILELFAECGITHEWFDDVIPSIWTKYVFIAAFGMVTACFGKTLGEVMESSDLRGRVLGVMEEITALARKKGIRLPDTIVEDSFRKGAEFPPETKTSFQRDVERQIKPDEREIFGGAVLRLGRETGVATPVTRELCGILERRKPLPA